MVRVGSRFFQPPAPTRASAEQSAEIEAETGVVTVSDATSQRAW